MEVVLLGRAAEKQFISTARLEEMAEPAPPESLAYITYGKNDVRNVSEPDRQINQGRN